MDATHEPASARAPVAAPLPGVVVLLLGVALVVRLGVCAWSPAFQFPDEFLYQELAQNIADHNAYAYETPKHGLYPVRQAPGLPLLLGLAGKVLTLSPLNCKLVNATVAWLAIAVLALLVWRQTGRPAVVGLLVLLAGLHPAHVFTSATNYPQSFQTLCVSLLALSLVRWIDHPAAGPAGFRPGLWMGVGALFVPTQIFLVPAVWLARVVTSRTGLLRYSMALGLGVLLPVLPWTLRNAVVERAFIPFSTSGGEQFALGFCDQAGPNTGVQISLPEPVLEKVRQARSGHEVEAICKEAGRAWIRAHPVEAGRLWLLKFANFFRWDTGSLVTAEQGGGKRAWLSRMSSLAVMGIGVVGIGFLIRRERGLAVFAVAAMLFLAAGHACFLSRYRYRLPFEPLLLAWGLWGWTLRRRNRPSASPSP
jgi:hypothetical protein